MASQLSDIRPRRVSLVKRGANLRRILLAKSDEENLDGFVSSLLAAPVEKEDELLAAVEAAHGDESVAKAVSTLVRAADGLREPFGDEFRDAIVKAAREQMLDEDADDAAPDDDGDNDGDGDEDDVAKAYETLIKREFTADERKKLAASGAAMSDGSYPIENKDDLDNAIHAVGRGKNNSHQKIRAHIIQRAKSLGATSMLPGDWNIQKEDGSMSETAQAVPVRKEDGSWDLSAVPEENRDAVEKALETVAKEHEDELAELRKAKEAEESKADEAIRKADALTERIEKSDYVTISKSLDNLAKDDTEFGDLLYSIRKAEDAKHLPEGTFEKLETVLKAANESAAIFVEIGKTGHGEQKDAQGKLDAAAEEIRKAEPALTREQAVAKALDRDPNLYTEIRKES